ncbi:hypothetical protein RBA41_02305 [Massilia sp. CCM 9210]|uniref:hypothetical protein n=1 Tax=Massilia scottii TaxID=3057166 RepID=UPI0027967283|nr:hypothetical protein [Massilia sp. CCM 9210]MDQ1812126.1 hypothetical protein [Massilia sp. CCM 9210]
MDKAVLRELSLTEGLLNQLEADDLDHPFGYRCQPAYYWRSSPIAGRGIVALWECGTVISYFNQNNRRFEQCSLENIDEVWCSYSSLQGLLAELFIDVYEDEVEIDILIEYAKLFGFLSIERLLIEAQTPPEDYVRWRQGFARSCG